MQLDDLDFLLLDIASEDRPSLDSFLGNRRIPPHTFEELTLAFVELFGRGDAVASISRSPQWSVPWKRSRPFVPTRDEIEAGLRGGFDLVYELTSQGGSRWEAAVQADWSLYRSSREHGSFRWSEALSRERLEFGIEVDRAYGCIEGGVRWKELRPWRPVYWKEFPVAYRARCRMANGVFPSSSLGDVMGEYYGMPRWGMEYPQRFSFKPADLVPRRERLPAPGDAGEMASWPIEKLQHELESEREDRRRFAAVCAYAPRADTKELSTRLLYGYTKSAFASIRELARRREAAAVRPLTKLVLREGCLPALWALGEIGDERTLPVLEMLLEYGAGGGTLRRAIAQFGDRAMPLLERQLACKDYTARAGAITAIGVMGSEASGALLERELARIRMGGRVGASWEIENALGCHTSRWTAERLSAERLRQVRYVAGAGRNDPTPDDPTQALVDTLSHPESARRRAAVDLLVEFEARDRVPDIARLAKDPEWEVRASVAHALRRLGGSRRLLGVLAKDPNPAVRWLAKHPIIPNTE